MFVEYEANVPAFCYLVLFENHTDLSGCCSETKISE
jgi:hypothetical protein